jgi:O-antigen/teichoic acid export membrane protein
LAEISANKRIAKNTLMLYFRQILIMGVSLYTVRVVLNTLGAVDYGIYNVVAGVVTMFSFLSGAMATASQRYFSFDLGKKDYEQLKKTFSVTLSIYLLLILIVVVLAETVGLWFVYNKLVIPSERLHAAKWIYQFSIFSFAVTLITTPYMASIIAHENMNVYAYVSIVEALLKLVIVFLLKKLPYDKLIVYGILLFIVGFINTAMYRLYCKKHYDECRFKPLWDKSLFKEIFNFTGWSLFGAFTTVARTQAITILVNQFFNPVIVAARAISMQVTSALNVFSSNFNTSLYAPIVKEYAADNKERMFSLIFNGCKMTFFLMWIFALPLCLRMEFVLTLWLKNLPDYVVLFTILSVIEVLISSISLPIATAARAPGKMKKYELTIGILQLSIFIVSFLWIKYFNGMAEVVFYTSIIIIFIIFLVRLFIVRGLLNFSLRKFIIQVFYPITLISIVSTLFSFYINTLLPENFISLCILILVTFMTSSLLMFFIGIDEKHRVVIISHIFKFNKKSRGKNGE